MNHRRILDLFDVLYRFGGLANQEIADRFDLAPSTVTQLTQSLRRDGLLYSLDPEHYPAHRKQDNKRSKALITPRSEYGSVATIDVRPAEISVSLVDFSLEIARAPQPRSLSRFPAPAGTSDRAGSSERDLLVRAIASAVKETGDKSLRGVGLSVSGTIDPIRNVLTSSIHLPYLVEEPFAAAVESEVGLPVTLVNDAHAIAVGERYRGVARNLSNFIAIHIDDGVGAGIYADGRLYRGWDNRAGEIGSMVIDPDGDIGVSGRRGCFEDAVSRVALHTRLRHLALQGVASAAFGDERFESPSEVFTLLRDYFSANDSLVRTIVHDVSDRIGLVAANVSAAFSPQLLVLCGPLCELGDGFLELVRTSLKRYAVNLPPEELDRHVRLEPEVERFKAIGAAKTAFDKHLQSL
jgi:glucokinase